VGYCVTFSINAPNPASASFLLRMAGGYEEYAGAYDALCNSLGGEGCGSRIFPGGARLARSKVVQTKRGSTAKTQQYAGPIKVMNVREVAAYLHVHPSTIYRLLKHNRIPAFHVGSDWRFNIETIDNWRLAQGKLGS
jgi:excisionase family DNA binding protein